MHDSPLDLLDDSLAGEVTTPLLSAPDAAEWCPYSDPAPLPEFVGAEHLSFMKPDFQQAYDIADYVGGEDTELARRVIVCCAFAASLGVGEHFTAYYGIVERVDHITTASRIGQIRNGLALRTALKALETTEPMLRTLPVRPSGPTVYALLGLDPEGPPLAEQLGVNIDGLPRLRGRRSTLSVAKVFPAVKHTAIVKLEALERMIDAPNVVQVIRSIREDIACADSAAAARLSTHHISGQIEDAAIAYESVVGNPGEACRVCEIAEGATAVSDAFGLLDDCERFSLPHAKEALKIVDQWIPSTKLKVAKAPPPLNSKSPSKVALPEHGNIPAWVFDNLPGVIGDAYRYVMARAVKQQPVLALAAALAMAAPPLGRKVMAVGGGRPNLFLMSTALTGSGKDWALVFVKEAYRESGTTERFLGVESFTSDSAIEASISQPGQESCVMPLDEVGKMFSQINNKSAAVSLAAATDVILKVYSASSSSYQLKARASGRGAVIDQPHVSIFGVSTPDAIWKSLQSGSINDGLLNRFLLFDCGEHQPEYNRPADIPFPAAIVEWIRAWADEPTRPNPMMVTGGHAAAQPRAIPYTAEAGELRDSIAKEASAWLRTANKDGYGPLVARVFENTIRLALISACAWGPGQDLLINVQDLNWAYAIAKASAERMIEVARDHIADSPFELRTKRVYAHILKGGARGATKGDIANKMRAVSPRELIESLDALRVQGRVSLVDTNATLIAADGRKMRPREAYVANELHPDWEPDEVS